MKKYDILILTFHRAQSYGAFLQAYALQNCTAFSNVDVRIMDYYPSRFHLKNYIFPISGPNVLVKAAKFLPAVIAKGRMHLCVQRHVRDYLKLTKEQYKKPDELIGWAQQANVFLIGSDQVWDLRYDAIDEIKPYYLSFTNNPKYAYASSCGEMEFYRNKDQKKIKVLLDLLEKFQHITVRERYSAEDLNKCGNYNCEMMLDPTFLLDGNSWKKIAKNTKNKKYVLVYGLYRNKALYDFAKTISKENNLSIVNICDMFDFMKGAKNIFNITPFSLVGLIASADYVVTDSFHGCALTLNLNKELFIFEPATSKKRISNLVSLLGIKDRVVGETIPDTKKRMEYGEINHVLETERKKANDYLVRIAYEARSNA